MPFFRRLHARASPSAPQQAVAAVPDSTLMSRIWSLNRSEAAASISPSVISRSAQRNPLPGCLGSQTEVQSGNAQPHAGDALYLIPKAGTVLFERHRTPKSSLQSPFWNGSKAPSGVMAAFKCAVHSRSWPPFRTKRKSRR